MAQGHFPPPTKFPDTKPHPLEKKDTLALKAQPRFVSFAVLASAPERMGRISTNGKEEDSRDILDWDYRVLGGKKQLVFLAIVCSACVVFFVIEQPEIHLVGEEGGGFAETWVSFCTESQFIHCRASLWLSNDTFMAEICFFPNTCFTPVYSPYLQLSTITY